MKNMRSTRGRAAVGVVGLLLILSGCGSGSSSNTAGGGILRIGTDVDLEQSDNVQIRITSDRQIMGSTVFEPLFTSSPKGTPTPALAKSGVSSNGDKTWTLTLQSGVTFQDGKPFTADDVKANFQAMLDPKTASDIAGDFSNVKSVKVIDPTTVQFDLKLANNQFPESITDYPLIGDMTERAKEGAKAYAQHPIGTGPYQFVSRKVGDSINFKRYPRYWRGTPPLAGVQFRVIPDPSVAALALQNGDIDMITNSEVAAQALPGLEKDQNLQVLQAPSNTISHAFMNFGSPRADQYKNVLAMHKGLAYLFNAAKIVPAVVGDFGSLADQELPSWQPGSDPNLQAYPYDPQKGIALLTQAGFPPGSTLYFVVINGPDLCPIATAIQSQIEQLGYKVDLKCSDAQNAGVGPNYQWDVVFNASSGRADAGTYFHDRWDIGLAQAKDDKNTFESNHLQSLIDSIDQQANLSNGVKIAQKASDYVVRDQAAIVDLFFAKTWVVASKKVTGLELSSLGWQSFLMNSYTTVKLAS